MSQNLVLRELRSCPFLLRRIQARLRTMRVFGRQISKWWLASAETSVAIILVGSAPDSTDPSKRRITASPHRVTSSTDVRNVLPMITNETGIGPFASPISTKPSSVMPGMVFFLLRLAKVQTRDYKPRAVCGYDPVPLKWPRFGQVRPGKEQQARTVAHSCAKRGGDCKLELRNDVV